MDNTQNHYFLVKIEEVNEKSEAGKQRFRISMCRIRRGFDPTEPDRVIHIPTDNVFGDTFSTANNIARDCQQLLSPCSIFVKQYNSKVLEPIQDFLLKQPHDWD